MGDVGISKIVRTKRKTLALQVTRDAEVVVRAPLRTPDFFIHAFVQKHTDWIVRKKKEMSSRVPAKRRFTHGEEFFYLGKKHVLVRDQNCQGSTLTMREGIFFLGPDVIEPKTIFEKWYKKQAHEIIIPRVKDFALRYGFSYNTIRITSARTRFGSCSGKKNISFSWRLISAPEEVIDYVIIHELSHLKHMNHSSKFWKTVGELCPEFKAHRKWLKDASKQGIFL